MIVAIDGPAGSGKSTAAKLVASCLGFRYLDTGAMYRAVAVRALELGVDLDDEGAVGAIASAEAIGFGHLTGSALPASVTIAGRDVTRAIRTPEADAAVSHVARLPRVREAMVAQQRAIAHASDVVVEGRDIGTVVFPEADVKVFLTADPEERARRRAVEHAESGHEVDTSSIAEAMTRRDLIDSTREVAPLKPAPDAIDVDTTGLTVDQVVERIVGLVEAAR